MPQKIHYRDDLYLISVLIKALEAGFAVEADPEYFKEKNLADILFIDGIVESFHELLALNSHLIDRAEYLKLLERNVSDVARILRELLSGRSPAGNAYVEYYPQIEGVLERQEAVLAELKPLLDTAIEAGGSEADLVSQDELSQLLGG